MEQGENMRFSIIPDFSSLDKTVSFSEKNDVSWEYNDFCYPDVYEDEAEIKRRIITYTEINRDRSNDTMHGAFLGLDLAAIDPVIRDRSRELCKQSISIANRLGVKGVVFHTGLIGELRLDYYLNNWLEQSVFFWTEICSHFPDLMIYIENSFEQEPDIFVKLMERMNGVLNFKVCFDYGHAILTKTPIEKWCSVLAPYIGHMHLNDNDLQNDLHLVPGKGRIDYKQWMELLRENDIDCSVLLEITGIENTQSAYEYMSKIMREQ